MHDELIKWLNEQLERTNLSQSEASRRAGLGQNAISEIVNGRIPGLRVCMALADFFGYEPEYILRLAGHLSPPQPDNDINPKFRATAERLFAIWESLEELDPDSLDRLLNVVIVQAEMVEAAARVAAREESARETE